jgi:hypothetical protein
MTALETIELELWRLIQHGGGNSEIVHEAAKTILRRLRRTPAAWRARDLGDGWILYSQESAAAAYRAETDALVQPLFVLEA